MGNLRNVVYLTETQLEELRTNGTITVGGTTIEYSDNDLYVTPLDDFDGIYATEADLTAVESGVLDNTERIETLENEPVNELVVQGKSIFTETEADEKILNITIPAAIVQKLSSPFAAKATLICLEQEMTMFVGGVSGTVLLPNTVAAMFGDTYAGVLMPLSGSSEGYITVGNTYDVIIDLASAGITISAGYHYFYKIEFIC